MSEDSRVQYLGLRLKIPEKKKKSDANDAKIVVGNCLCNATSPSQKDPTGMTIMTIMVDFVACVMHAPLSCR